MMTGQRWVKSLFFQYSRALDEKNNDLTGSQPVNDQSSLKIQEVTFLGHPLYIAYPRIANLAGNPKVGNSELGEY